MGLFTHLPDAEYLNQDWTLEGSGVTRLHEAWDDDDDDNYAACPNFKGRAAVMFPTNVETLPEGANITSISVFVRANKTDTSSRSLTINLLSTDNTSLFSTRTLYLSEDITTYEVGTYTKDVLNKAWTISRLNKLVAQVYAYGNLADAVRVYKVYVQVNYHTKPVVEVTGPTGTQITASPTLVWNYSQADGDLQGYADYKIFTEFEHNKTTFNPDVSTHVLSGNVQGNLTEYQLTDTLDRGQYYAYVRVTSTYGTKSSWAGRLFSVEPELPGSPYIETTPDNVESKVTVDLINATNLLSLHQASAEITSDAPEYVTTNCELGPSTDVRYGNGSRSYKLTAASAADISVISTYIPVAAEVELTSRAQIQSFATSRTATTTVYFYNELYEEIGTPWTSSAATTVGEWEEYITSDVTPEENRYIRFEVGIAGCADEEVHYIDGLGIMYGDGTSWSTGGHFSRNMLSTAYSAHPQASMFTAAEGTSLSNRTDVDEEAADSPNALRMTAVEVASSLSYVAIANTSGSTSGTTFTLNKPTGTVEGDLMIAVLTSTDAGVLYPPNGWEYVNTAAQDTPEVDTGLWILYRVFEDGDPTSWTATVSDPSTGRRCSVVSYRGAAIEQFIAENVKTHYGAPSTATTQTVANDDPNAWRMAVFSARDETTGSWSSATDGEPGDVQYISYVSTATPWRSINYKQTFFINRPPGVKENDLMIATVGMWGVANTVNTPSGWSKVQHTISSGTFPMTLCIFTRTAGASEPSSWSASTSHTDAGTRVSQCVAYRGAEDHTLQFIAEDGQSASSSWVTNKATTPTVSNTDGRAWRFAAFASNAADPGYWSNSNESRRRGTATIEFVTGNNAMTVGVFDSNGVVSTGSHNRHAYWYNSRSWYYSRNFHSGASWIGIIKARPGSPPSGNAQTERVDGSAGNGSHNITTAIYDSNGTIDIGDSAITAVYSATPQNVVSWVGVIRPLVPVPSGEVKATMDEGVNITEVSQRVLDQSSNRITFGAHFLGDAPGTSFVTLKFYEANQLLSSQTVEAGSYGPDIWTPAYATFDLVEGTTDLVGEFHSSDRAIDGTVDIDRLFIGFGEETNWRSGTSEPLAHPVWNQGIVQYADDTGDGQGFSEWQNLYGTTANPPIYDPFSGRVTYLDHTPVPRVERKYRAATVSYGLLGDVFQSPWSEDSETVTITPESWWLKDPADPTNNLQMYVRAEDVTVGTTNTSSVFQPIGTNFPIVLSEGIKADKLSLAFRMNRADWLRFQILAKLGRTLYLQSDVDNAWWVRIADDLTSSTIVSADRQNNPIRWVEVSFVQVAPEE